MKTNEHHHIRSINSVYSCLMQRHRVCKERLFWVKLKKRMFVLEYYVVDGGCSTLPGKFVAIATTRILTVAKSGSSDTTPVIRSTFSCASPINSKKTTVANKKRFFRIIHHQRIRRFFISWRPHRWIRHDHG